MIYSLLKVLIKVSVKIFFKSQEWKGKEKIPSANTPLLIVANHPGTFMDPLVIAAGFNRAIFFLAKAEVFKSKLAQRILPKINMIPVYRKQDDASQMHKNEETFGKCFEHLTNKGCILIFPEGISITERKLRQIKTGAARIALGAEAKHKFTLGVQILPVGINYSHEIKFQSNLLLRVGEPINIIDYKTDYEANNFAAAEKITEEIRLRLEELIIAVKDDETERLSKTIEQIFKNKILSDRGVLSFNIEQDFDASKKIAAAVEYFNEKDPERVAKVKQETEEYFSILERLKLSDRWVEGLSQKGSLLFEAIGTIVYLVVGFPFYVFGVTNNYLPYKLPYLLAKKISKRPEFWGALTMAFGILTFMLFYSAVIYFIYHFTQSLAYSFIYSLIMPLSGFFAFKYWKKFVNVKGKLFLTTMFMKRSALIASLITRRERIVNELQKGREEFNKIIELK